MVGVVHDPSPGFYSAPSPGDAYAVAISRLFAANVNRDARNEAELKRLGWDVKVVWECETTNERRLSASLGSFLNM